MFGTRQYGNLAKSKNSALADKGKINRLKKKKVIVG